MAAPGGRLPDFLGIGAQKAGSTWLHKHLALHPGIWLPRWKELHFFDRLHRARPGWVDAIRPYAGRRVRSGLRKFLAADISDRDWRGVASDFRFYLARRDASWYAGLFQPDDDQAAGEITPAYSTLTMETVNYVNSLIPDAKLVFLMRNPIERTWSAAIMGLQQETGIPHDSIGLERLRSITEKPSSELRDNYLRTIDTWAACYPPERILIGFLEDIRFRPQLFLDRTFDFLEVSRVPVNAGGKEHARAGDWMPVEVARYLADRHYELIAELARRFGNPAQKWLEIAEWLLGDRLDDRIPYPLWETPPGREDSAQGVYSNTLSHFE